MPNIVIIGSGPAGVSAALYAARAGVQTTVLTKGPGALDRAELIQNYYGFAEPITGAELERRGIEGAKAVGVEFVTTEAVGLTYTDKLTVETLAGDFPADAVILATGASRAAPRIPGLAGLEGHGVSYCATCDAFFYRGRDVAVHRRGPADGTVPAGSGRADGSRGRHPRRGAGHRRAAERRRDTESLRRVRGAGRGRQHCPGPQAGSRGERQPDRGGDCTGGLLQVAKAVYEGALAGTEAAKALRK